MSESVAWIVIMLSGLILKWGSLLVAFSSRYNRWFTMVKNSLSDMNCCNDSGVPLSPRVNGGFGLKSVRELAARHGGELLTEWDTQTFTAYVAVSLMIGGEGQ